MRLFEVKSDASEAECIFRFPESSVRSFRFSPCGQHVLIGVGDGVAIYSVDSKKLLAKAPVTSLQEFAFYSSGSLGSKLGLLVILQKPLSGIIEAVSLWLFDPAGSVVELHKFSGKSLPLVFSPAGKPENLKYSWKVLRWTPGNPDIQAINVDSNGLSMAKIRFEGSIRPDSISISPNRSSMLFAVFSKANASRQTSLIGIYRVPDTFEADGSFTALKCSQRTLLSRVDRVDFRWAPFNSSNQPSDTRCLAIVHTEVDSTNQSYYGQDQLYLLTSSEGEARVELDLEGPIHDLAWHPRGTEFVVIYGFMPAARTCLFSAVPSISNPSKEGAKLGKFVFRFPALSSVNTVAFNADGSALAFAGFGNLAGPVQVWSRRSMQCLGIFEAPNSTILQWSIPLAGAADSGPASQALLTAVLTPRMRVDNGVALWTWNGQPLARIPSIPGDEFYGTLWRPGRDRLLSIPNLNSHSGPCVDRRGTSLQAPATLPASASSSSSSTNSGAYRPPHLRNASPSLTRSAEGMLVRNLPSGKKFASDEKASTANPTPPPPPAPSTITKEERQVQRLRAKLSQIEELKIKLRESGPGTLQANQLEKIASEAAVSAELEQALANLKL